MSKSDISFLWPLTALSFVFATLAAMFFLAKMFRGFAGSACSHRPRRGVHQLQRACEGKNCAASEHSTAVRPDWSRESDFRQNVRQPFRGEFGFLLQLH